MAKRRADLVNEALTRLGALPAGQEASSEDYDYVDDRVVPVLEDLAQREITVATPEDIPDAAFMSIAAVLAFHCKGYFGVVEPEATMLANNKIIAERDLKFLSRRVSQNKPVKAEYF